MLQIKQLVGFPPDDIAEAFAPDAPLLPVWLLEVTALTFTNLPVLLCQLLDFFSSSGGFAVTVATSLYLAANLPSHLAMSSNVGFLPKESACPLHEAR